MVSAELDHLVIVADSLTQGVAWCEQTLGLTPGPGGRHVAMGTHNRLLRLEGEAWPQAYLEIIAIDPQAPSPARPRWFGMDDPRLQAAVREAPRLVHLVMRTRQLERLRRGLIDQGTDPGAPLSMQRETPQGLLQWRMLVRDDGAIGADGCLPTLIEWTGRHPADAMPASGLALQGLALGGLPQAMTALLGMRGVGVAPDPGLTAELSGPHGRVTLHSFPRSPA